MHGNAKDADDVLRQLNKMNYTDAHILPDKTYRVAIQSFGTKEEAVCFMQDLRASNPQFADAWVLSNTGK